MNVVGEIYIPGVNVVREIYVLGVNAVREIYILGVSVGQTSGAGWLEIRECHSVNVGPTVSADWCCWRKVFVSADWCCWRKVFSLKICTWLYCLTKICVPF